MKLPKKIQEFVQQHASHFQPSKIHYCLDTSPQSFSQYIQKMTQMGICETLKRPNSYLIRTDPGDVARSEESTFICSETEQESGPTNYWREPTEMKRKLSQLFEGTMKGRTMYVIPFSMGPIGSSQSIMGVQLTDSPYVAASMSVMTRVGQQVLDHYQDFFVPCLHSVGQPLQPNQADHGWPCNLKERLVCHFPKEKEIWSYGSGYGGNSLLGKKALALRIASVIGHEQGWLAEHMLILKLTNPQGKKKYIAAAFPSACGKTNLAMMMPTIKGWRVECVGDDICWMRFKEDGKLYAINPENGFFGVAPGTNEWSNPNALQTIQSNTVFTNCASTADGDVWWQGLTMEVPKEVIDWKGQKWDGKSPAAHPNARFTVPLRQCPIIDPEIDNPEGVPIDAILFGGRRKNLVPLVFETLNWRHGTLVGASVASEKTAAAEGGLGELRFDPFAMLPFCGYHMGDYFQHWLNMQQPNRKLTKIFHVNWFRQQNGKFLWPGFGDNSRVLKWIFERCDGKVGAEETPIGFVPKKEDLDLSGLSVSNETMNQLLKVDREGYLKELKKVETYFEKFGNKFPRGLRDEMNQLRNRLQQS